MSSIISSFQPLEYKGQRVLPTESLAKSYGSTSNTILRNFQRNQDRYTEGKHYFALEGDELKTFSTTLHSVMQSDASSLSEKPSRQNVVKVSTPILYVWTKKGAFLHAKSLKTDEAWDVYEQLIDGYYEQIDQITLLQNHIRNLSAVIAKGVQVPSLPPNTLRNVTLSEAETAIARLRGYIKPLREYAEKAQSKTKAGGLSASDAQSLVTLLRSMHENLNTVHTQAEHQQTVMDELDIQFIQQESLIKRITQALQLPTPQELVALPEPN